MQVHEGDARVIRIGTTGADLLLVGESADELTRVRDNGLVLTSEWGEMFAEGRLRTRAQAVSLRVTAPRATFSHTTAAALHGLPLYRLRSDRVDMVVPGDHPRRNGVDIVRHHQPLKDDEIVVVDGIRVTDLVRTVYDVIRTVPLEAAVACIDAAMRKAAWDEDSRTYDIVAAEAFRSRITGLIRRGTGARGIRQARFVVDFADGRAQLPGESIARLWMYFLGLPRPVLQYRVDLEDGGFALLDFAWPALGRWAEFDGDVKYTSSALLAGRTKEEVLAAQLSRERAIRRVTGWSVDRWGFAQMSNISGFARYLRSVGLYP